MNSLAQLASDWRGDMPADGLMLEAKRDGWRALRFPGIDGVTRLWTRGGLPIEAAEPILSRLAAMERAAGEPMMFDGELQVGGSLAATKAWCERGWKLGEPCGIFYAFDCLTVADWRAGGSDVPLYQRKRRLRDLWDAAEWEGDGWTWPEGSKGADAPIPVQLVPDVWISTPADAVQEMRRAVGPACDGVVLKAWDAPYRRNRNPAWLKVKPENAHKWRLAA